MIVPLIDEFTKVRVNEEVEPTIISPAISWLVKVKETVPPFEPLVPQSPSSTLINVPEPYVKVQSVNLISASVLVTKNIGALS